MRQLGKAKRRDFISKFMKTKTKKRSKDIFALVLLQAILNRTLQIRVKKSKTKDQILALVSIGLNLTAPTRSRPIATKKRTVEAGH